MFERFTERARQVVVFAQDEARTLRHNYLGTEHLLLGLLREEEGIAARVLESLDIELDSARTQVGRIVGEGDEVTPGQIPLTPRAKKVLELSLREAMRLGHNYIGTEHILLGLARENEGVAARILLDFGADAEKVRGAVVGALSGDAPPAFTADSPPVAPEAVAEIERLQHERQQAMQAQEFEKASRLMARERRLVAAAKQLMRAWNDEPEPAPTHRVREPNSALQRRARSERRRRAWQAEALLVGWSLFGSAAALGLLVGWLIWG
jgi:ATP-dependent Clp protease ATP-binding subunit ClpA